MQSAQFPTATAVINNLYVAPFTKIAKASTFIYPWYPQILWDATLYPFAPMRFFVQIPSNFDQVQSTFAMNGTEMFTLLLPPALNATIAPYASSLLCQIVEYQPKSNKMKYRRYMYSSQCGFNDNGEWEFGQPNLKEYANREQISYELIFTTSVFTALGPGNPDGIQELDLTFRQQSSN